MILVSFVLFCELTDSCDVLSFFEDAEDFDPDAGFASKDDQGGWEDEDKDLAVEVVTGVE